MYNKFRSAPNFFRFFLYFIPIQYRLGGKNFLKTYRFLKNTDKWSRDKIINLQKKELHKLLDHAVKHVKFYSNITLSSQDPYKNLEKFPIIDKETMQDDIKLFLADNILRRNTYHVTTGGTSGNPFSFILDNSTYGKEWAFVVSSWKRVGFTLGDRIVSFRGVEFRNTNKGIFWQHNPMYNMLEMSPFHMSEENIPKYIEKIRMYKPHYLYGYPSALSLLAEIIREKEWKFPPIKAVLAVSENVYPAQRELIQNTFNTRLFSFYGMSEKVIMAPECEYDTRYHSMPEYGVTELVDRAGNPVEMGTQGELVGTGFLNYCLPFIRYKTGDLAVFGKQECKCKRNHLIIEQIVGRSSEEFIIGKSGSQIPFNALYIAIHSEIFSHVRRFQFHQRKIGEIILRIIPKPNFSDIDKENLLKAIYERVGDEVDIDIEEVETIDLTHRGKFKVLIQEIPLHRGS